MNTKYYGNYGYALTDSEIHTMNTLIYERLFGIRKYSDNYGLALTDSEIHRKRARMYAQLFPGTTNYQTAGNDKTHYQTNFSFVRKALEDSENASLAMKKSELSDIARRMGADTTGKKSDILGGIKEKHESFYNKRGVTIYSNSKCADDVIDYITKEQTHIILTKAAMWKLCGTMKSGRRYSCDTACQQMVFSNFSEPKFEDITQNVWIALNYLAKADAIVLFNNKLVNVSGFAETSPFIVTMRTIQRFFYDEKTHIQSKVITNSELLTESSEYLFGSVNVHEEYSEFKLEIEHFVRWLGTRLPRYQKIAKDFVYGEIMGYSQSEIFANSEFSGNIQYTVRKIRELYVEYTSQFTEIRNKGEILADLDTIRGQLGNIQKPIESGFKYSAKKVTTIQVAWSLPVYPRSYQKVLADRRNDAYIAFAPSARDRKLAELEEVFGIGGLVDQIAQQKADDERYISENSNVTLEKPQYRIEDDYVVATIPGIGERKYPIQKKAR